MCTVQLISSPNSPILQQHQTGSTKYPQTLYFGPILSRLTRFQAFDTFDTFVPLDLMTNSDHLSQTLLVQESSGTGFRAYFIIEVHQ